MVCISTKEVVVAIKKDLARIVKARKQLLKEIEVKKKQGAESGHHEWWEKWTRPIFPNICDWYSRTVEKTKELKDYKLMCPLLQDHDCFYQHYGKRWSTECCKEGDRLLLSRDKYLRTDQDTIDELDRIIRKLELLVNQYTNRNRYWKD